MTIISCQNFKKGELARTYKDDRHRSCLRRKSRLWWVQSFVFDCSLYRVIIKCTEIDRTVRWNMKTGMTLRCIASITHPCHYLSQCFLLSVHAHSVRLYSLKRTSTVHLFDEFQCVNDNDLGQPMHALLSSQASLPSFSYSTLRIYQSWTLILRWYVFISSLMMKKEKSYFWNRIHEVKEIK